MHNLAALASPVGVVVAWGEDTQAHRAEVVGDFRPLIFKRLIAPRPIGSTPISLFIVEEQRAILSALFKSKILPDPPILLLCPLARSRFRESQIFSSLL